MQSYGQQRKVKKISKKLRIERNKMKGKLFVAMTLLLILFVGNISFAEDSPFFKEFFAMDTATKDAEHETPDLQAAIVKELGFTGMAWTGFEQLPELKSALQTHGLKLYAIYLWGSIEKDGFQIQPGLAEVLETMKGNKYFLWLTINSQTWKTDEPEARQQALALIHAMADQVSPYGVKIALYPHAGCWLEKTEQAFQLAQDSGKANVGISFNLCHSLKSDGQDTNLDLLIRKVETRLFVITINGAEVPGNDWDKLIQPLDKGNFDLKPLLITLKSVGYTGPIGLQGYGIQEPVKGHLPRSMEAWKKLVASVSTYQPIRISTDDLQSFREPTGDWYTGEDAILDPNDETRLTALPGVGVLINGKEGKTNHLITKDEFGDVELHIEFMVPKGSNSGVYFQGRYEIQVLDSWGVAEPKYSDCGGIYQRWHEEPGLSEDQRGYEGKSPRVNASRPPGTWQSFDVIFKAPRFDSEGKKVANAKFVRVVYNGVIVHENEEVSGPTRAALYNDEAPKGPVMLQGDHGPVAYRNFWIRPLTEKE